jgi:hypothetical protein
LVNLDKWRPGWALAAVGGGAADWLDVDPRNGGDETAEAMQSANEWPRTFGRQATPSGGYHDLISATGERKIVLAPGVDLQAGAPDGTGRGFVWLAPTVGTSKITGEPVAYRWVQEPNTDQLLEWRGDGGEVLDDSLTGVISRVQAKRSPAILPRQRGEQDPGDPFATASSLAGERSFSLTQAQDFLRPTLVGLQQAPIGEIEERCNVAATALSHFVPAFWSPEQAYGLLLDALSHTAYDPDRPGAAWRAEKFRPVLDGTRPVVDPWVATRAVELDRSLFHPDVAPEHVAPPTTSEEATSLVDQLLGEMLTVGQMIQRPPPRPLILGVLDLDSEAWIIGAPGSRKSFVALDFARCVATGSAWQGRRVTQGPVIYIAAEGSSGLSLRIRAILEAHGPIGDDLRILPRPVQARDPVAWEVLVAACHRLRPALVILDTQARVTVGLEENSATDMGLYVEAVRRIRERTGACVLTIHHSGRAGVDARGSSAVDGAQGTELRVQVDGERSHLRGSLVMDKQKDMAEVSAGIPLQFGLVDMGTDPETERPLTSLVVKEADPFMTSQYIPEAWEEELVKGHVQGQIIRVLRDQGRTTGLTKAECLRNLSERFGTPKRTSFNTAWSVVLERVDDAGEPIIGASGGQRYAVQSLKIINAGPFSAARD